MSARLVMFSGCVSAVLVGAAAGGNLVLVQQKAARVEWFGEGPQVAGIRQRLDHFASTAKLMLTSPFPQAPASKAMPELDPVDSHMSTLEQSVAAMLAQGAAALEAKRAAYEANLTAQARENHELGRQNAQRAQELAKLRSSIADQRANAKRLLAENEELRGDIVRVRANISIARDFARDALNRSVETPDNTPELAILAEIDNEETQQRDQTARELHLAAVGRFREKAMLLQIGDGPSVQDVIMALTSNLDGLASAQEAAEASLTENYEKDYKVGAALTRTLLQDREYIEVMYAADATTKDAIDKAVDTLQSTQKELKATRGALFGFLRHLAATS